MIDVSAMYKIGYGLYVVTCNDGGKDNGLVVNSVMQVTSDPLQVAVAINKKNYSHGVILESGEMNVNCLTEEAPFSLFERFGFASGADRDKMEGLAVLTSENHLRILPEFINSWFSLKVKNYVDLGTHGMFLCDVTEAATLSDQPSMTYAYYHAHTKPAPAAKKTGYVCKICGYVHEGDTLPEDFVCPWCKHGADAFEKVIQEQKSDIAEKKEPESSAFVCDVCRWRYDEGAGLPERGILPGTKFSDLPADFACPLCGAPKNEFTSEALL